MKYILPSFVLGFHGCDLSTKEKILRGKDSKLLQPSKNDYDWLGSGIYFWENDPERAFSYANLSKKTRNDVASESQNRLCWGLLLN